MSSLADPGEDRYSRLRLMPWWDQSRVSNARVMVVGAGALGNEIIKDLALLGVGEMLIVDFDAVEESNLSRSTLFRASDEGHSKAAVACAAARELSPASRASALNADVTKAVGAGVFRWADVVLCGLDNREARLAVNRACWKVNRPWVDGATESLQGVARVFVPPDGPCYECTLSEQDQQLMEVRNSCGFFAKEAQRQGHTPTTPTASAVIAGIEVQEAMKLLHADAGLPGLAGKGFFFDGLSYDCFTIEYVRREDCLSHETYERVVATDLESQSATPADVISEAGRYLSGSAAIDLPGEMITALNCRHCGQRKEFFRLLRSIDVEEALCSQCQQVMVPDVTLQCDESSAFAHRTLAELGFGLLDILGARSGDDTVHVEISGDRQFVFAQEDER